MQICQRDNINRICEEKNLDELNDFGGVVGVAEALNTHLAEGIAAEDIRQRYDAIIKFPQNCLPPVSMFFYFLGEAFRGWTIFLLAVNTALSFAFGIVEEGLKKCWFDSLILVVSMFVLVIFKLAQMYWARIRLLKKLYERKRKTVRETTELNVIRGGIEISVPCSTLVYGDIICLREGLIIPANGLFVCDCGETLEVRDYDDNMKFHIDCQDPFLLLGSEVIKGDARMLVTSVGEEAAWTQRMRRATEASHTCFGFDKLRNQIHVAGLVISVLVTVVLFLRYFFHQKDDERGYRPEIKGEPVEFGRMINGIGKIVRESKLTSLICVSLVGMTEGLPFVVSIATAHWKLEDYATVDTSLLLKTGSNSSVTIICSTKIDWLTDPNHQEAVRDVMKALTEGEVHTIIVSEDEIDALRNTVSEIGVDYPDLDNDAVVKGGDFHQFPDEERMEKVDKICIMGNSSLPHKLLLVKCLKRKGKVVLTLGEYTAADGLLIKKSDFGRYMDTMSFSYLIGITKFGRFINGIMGKLIQTELILTLASWSINLITVMITGDAPLTTLQLVWLNILVAFPGGLALLSGHSLQKVLEDKIKPCKPLITKAVWRNIIVQVSYQIGIFVALQCKGKDIHGIGTQELSKSIIFNAFALCQFFNIFCAREPEKKSIFKGLGHNYWFWAVSGFFLVFQVAFVEVEPIFSNSSSQLNWKLWAVSFFIGAATLFFDCAGKFASEHIGFAESTASASINSTLQDRIVDM